MNSKKIFRFAKENYFLILFFLSIAFVVIVSFSKIFLSKPKYIYVKVKVGTGQNWSPNIRPNIWMTKAVQKGDKELDLLGQTAVEVLSVRYYPWYYSEQFETYLTLKIKVNENKKVSKFNFKRSAIGVGSPIELELPSIHTTGTIIALSEEEFKDTLIEKTILLAKKNAYPWEFDAIKVGETYFDGEENVFKIIDKRATDSLILALDGFERLPSASPVERRQYIIVKAKIKLKEKDGLWVFGEDQIVKKGQRLNLSTDNFTFLDYFVAEIN